MAVLPYYDHAGITIYHGDCRDVLPGLDRAVIDAIISDPPYGIGYRPASAGTAVRPSSGRSKSGFKRNPRSLSRSNERSASPMHGDDSPFDPTPWLNFSRVLLWGADRWPALPPGGRMLCWDKSVGRGGADDFVDGEFAWCNWRERRNVFRMLWKGLACEKQGENNGFREHPTQKPIRLMIWCIERAGAQAQTILDPFMGSGTTLVAAKELGRRAIGIEIEERYCEIAARRLQQDMLPLDVGPTVPRRTEPEQMEI